jgi:hypothetical protein
MLLLLLLLPLPASTPLPSLWVFVPAEPCLAFLPLALLLPFLDLLLGMSGGDCLACQFTADTLISVLWLFANAAAAATVGVATRLQQNTLSTTERTFGL